MRTVGYKIERFTVPLELGEAFEDLARKHYRTVPQHLRVLMQEALVEWGRTSRTLRRHIERGEKDA